MGYWNNEDRSRGRGYVNRGKGEGYKVQGCKRRVQGQGQGTWGTGIQGKGSWVIGYWDEGCTKWGHAGKGEV